MSARDTDRVIVWRYDPRGRWYWHYRAAGNSKILTDGGQGYVRKRDAITAAERVTHRVLVDPSHPDVGTRDWLLPLYVVEER